MAVIYLRSTDGDDASDGSTWALAKATLVGALAIAAPGDTIYVSDNHAESQASAMALTSPGTSASPVRIVCVDDTGDPQPPTARATGGSVTTTGSNSITFGGGYAYVYGLTITSGLAMFIGASTSPLGWNFSTCQFVLSSSSASADFRFGAVSSSSNDENRVLLEDCSFSQAGTSNSDVRNGRVEIESCSFGLNAIPTVAFTTTAGSYAQLVVRNCDLSMFDSLISVAGSSVSDVLFLQCKLKSGVSMPAATDVGGSVVAFINCDSADTNYRFYRASPNEISQSETTIVRTGGASDGVTTMSRKVVTTSPSIHFSSESMWIEFWNETVGSPITATVHVVTDNVTLTNAEAWLEVQYLGTSGFPLGLRLTDRVADPVFGTPANQASSSETWTTTGLGTPVKQALSVTFTPQEKGIVRCRVCVAKPSTTLYYCPKVDVS